MRPHDLISNQMLSELCNIGWNDFGEQEDHVIPHRHGEHFDISLAFCDPHKKTLYRDPNEVEKNTNIRASASNNISGRNEETACLLPLTHGSSIRLDGLPSYVSKKTVPVSCALQGNPVFGKGETADGGTAFHFSADYIPPADTLSFLENEHKERGIDLAHSNWSDIDTFMDVDEMFSSSIFGEEGMLISDGVPQFPSPSHAICGPQKTSFPGPHASHSRFSPLNKSAFKEQINSNILSELAEDDDHEVSSLGGKQVHIALSDSRIKPPDEVGNDIGQILESRGSGTPNFFVRREDTAFHSMKESSNVMEGSPSHASRDVTPTLHDHEGMAAVTALASQEAIISTHCLKECDMDTKSSSFCSKDPGTLRTQCIYKSSHCSLGYNSPPATWDRGYDLLNDNWPEINTFIEDDRIVRNYDSANGQGILEAVDDLPWFPSSAHRAFGSEKDSKLGLQSISELSAFDSTSRHHCPNANLFPKVACAVAGFENLPNIGCQSYAWDTSAESRGDSLLEKQVMHLMQLESQNSTHLNGKSKPSECANSSSFDDLNQTFNPYAQLEYNFPPHHVLFPSTAPNVKSENRTNPSTSCEVSAHVTSYAPICKEGFSNQLSELQLTKSCIGEQLCGASDVELRHVQAALTGEASLQETQYALQHERGCKTLPMDTSIGLPASEMDSSGVQESSCIASEFSDEINSFQKLQDILDQLDITTKKCISNVLYHLATSSGQGHSFSNTNIGGRMIEVATGTMGINASKECMEFIDDEAFRDPLHQSVARLLFVPLGYATWCTDNVVPLASHMMMPPTKFPKGLVDEWSSKEKLLKTVLNKSCPPRTLNIWLHTQKDELIKAKRYASYVHSHVVIKDRNHYAGISAQDSNSDLPVKYYGAQATMGVFNVSNVSINQASSGQISLIKGENGLQNHLNTIQFGWHVSEFLYPEQYCKMINEYDQQLLHEVMDASL